MEKRAKNDMHDLFRVKEELRSFQVKVADSKNGVKRLKR